MLMASIRRGNVPDGGGVPPPPPPGLPLLVPGLIGSPPPAPDSPVLLNRPALAAPIGAAKAGLFSKTGESGAGGGEPINPGTSNGNPGGGGGGTPPPSGTFPRRMLAISIHSYLYANPLHNGD